MKPCYSEEFPRKRKAQILDAAILYASFGCQHGLNIVEFTTLVVDALAVGLARAGEENDAGRTPNYHRIWLIRPIEWFLASTHFVA